MTEEESFVADMREYPDCVTRRLAYADWLEDRDRREQAAYVRLACELRNLDPQTKQARDVGEKLVGMLQSRPLDPQWREVWPGAAMDESVRAYTWLGLFETVVCPGPLWVERGDYSLRRWPIRRVIMTTRPEAESGIHVSALVGDESPVTVISNDEIHLRAKGYYTYDSTRAVCEIRWPGISFSVPGRGSHIPVLWSPVRQDYVKPFKISNKVLSQIMSDSENLV